MRAIVGDTTLDEFLGQESALLFFQAEWSQYSRLSEEMILMVERYANAAGNSVVFYSGCFEGDLVELGKTVSSLGVPNSAYAGNGSIALFRNGKFVDFIRSVVGEGNDSVWKIIGDS